MEKLLAGKCWAISAQSATWGECFSAFFYPATWTWTNNCDSARLPQIYKNYSDKSCEGLSLLFFILSLLGNLTYGAGILCHSTEREYVVTNLPWLIGSLGTMAEDVIIFIQFRIYAVQDDRPSAVA